MTVYEIQPARNGQHSLIAREQGRELRIHSAYDPGTEARRMVEAHNVGRASFLLVAGVGLGYHLPMLRERFPSLPVIAVERDGEVLSMIRRFYPEHMERVALITNPEDIQPAMDHLDMHTFRGISLFIHRPSYSLDRGFYDGMLDRFRQGISSRVSDLLTRFEFEKSWVKNIFSNLPRIGSSHRVESLFGRFRGCPGIIVSAGPSLKKNAWVLRELKDRAVIVAVDTAIKPLEKFGVQPHLVMTLDAQRHSVKHFLGLRDTGPLLLADMVSCPVILRDYPGDKMLSTTARYYTGPDGASCREATPVMSWIEQFITPLGDIQSGGSVATSAFDLLLTMGCDPIILTGQDLAYTGREIHTNGTHHNESWLPGTNRFLNLETINQRVIRKRSVKYVEAFGGEGVVISDFVFDLYRSWFEDSSAVAPVTVINATEGGARIRNTREMTLSSLAETLAPLPKTPGSIINEVLRKEKKASIDRLRRELTTAADILDRIIPACYFHRENPEELASEAGIEDLFVPWLRRTRLILARKNPDPEEEQRVIYRDMAVAARDLSIMLKRCLSSI